MAVPTSASARDFTSCCFRVQASSLGNVTSNWGSDRTGQYDGTHNAYWSWYSRELMEFRVRNGVPQLFPACYELPNHRLRCSPSKGRAHLGESSHFVQYPGNPSFRNDYGPCTNDVYTGDGEEWVNTRTGAVGLSPAGSNESGSDLLIAKATMVDLGTSKWDEKCWFGIGAHAAGGHEPGTDLSQLVSNTAWEAFIRAPAPERFRERGRFIVQNPQAFAHDQSSPESQEPEGPHRTDVFSLGEVRITPFRKARLPEEIEKLKRLE